MTLFVLSFPNHHYTFRYIGQFNPNHCSCIPMVWYVQIWSITGTVPPRTFEANCTVWRKGIVISVLSGKGMPIRSIFYVGIFQCIIYNIIRILLIIISLTLSEKENLSLKVAKNKVGENWRNNHQFVKGYSDCMFVFVFVNKCIIIYIAHEQNVLFIQ